MSRASAITAILAKHGSVTVAFDVGIGCRWDADALGARDGKAVVELHDVDWQPGEYISGMADVPGRADREPVCVLMHEIRWVSTPHYCYAPPG